MTIIKLLLYNDYNDLIGIYFDEYYELPDAKRRKIESKYDPDKLFLKTYNCDVWF